MESISLKKSYLEDFAHWEKTTCAPNPPWLKALREKALEDFERIGFPTTRDEDWKYTDLEPLQKIHYNLESEKITKMAVEPQLKSLGFETAKAYLAVFVNGHFRPELSNLKGLPKGVEVRGLWETLNSSDIFDLSLKEKFSEILPSENRPLVALNMAFFTDGLFLHIPKNRQLDKPLHVVYLVSNSGQPTQVHSRNLILLENDAQATVIEHYWANNLSPYFQSAVTKVSLSRGSFLDHTCIQTEETNGTHLGSLGAVQEEASRLVSRTFSLGGKLGRREVETLLSEKKAECLMEGLSLARSKQHLDVRTFVDHLAPSCKSEEMFKSVVDGESTAVFDGKILVREKAQKTDARQVNRNLELSKTAKVYSKPQLMIYADDVKCSHGSATGQLDEEALFYFQSRGIDREEARKTLIYAFAVEMVEKVSVGYLKGPLGQMVENWMREKS